MEGSLTGDAAFNWDAMALAQEQNLIQPLYLSTPAIGLIAAASKQMLAGLSELTKMKSIRIKPFPANGNLMDVGQRWEYGMQGMGYPNAKVKPALMPNPGANYTSYYDYKKQQYIVSPQYNKLRGAGASGSW